MAFKVGDRVKIAKDSVHYTGSLRGYNPICGGTIEFVERPSANGYNISVVWDNHNSNQYRFYDLVRE